MKASVSIDSSHHPSVRKQEIFTDGSFNSMWIGAIRYTIQRGLIVGVSGCQALHLWPAVDNQQFDDLGSSKGSLATADVVKRRSILIVWKHWVCSCIQQFFDNSAWANETEGSAMERRLSRKVDSVRVRPRCEQGLSDHSSIVKGKDRVAAKLMQRRVTVMIPDIHIHTPICRKRLDNLRASGVAGQMERCHAKTVSLIDYDALALQNLHHNPMVTIVGCSAESFFHCVAARSTASQRRTNKRQRQPGGCGSKKVASCENSKKARRCNLVRCDRCRQRAAS